MNRGINAVTIEEYEGGTLYRFTCGGTIRADVTGISIVGVSNLTGPEVVAMPAVFADALAQWRRHQGGEAAPVDDGETTELDPVT